MHFVQAPTRVPLACHLPDGTMIEGIAVIVAGEKVLQTSTRTFMFDRINVQLIQVCPFHPDVTLPADGWEIEQLSLYPTPGEQ